MKNKDCCSINKNNDCYSHDKNTQRNYQSHWNDVYDNISSDKLGWYEKNPEPTLKLLENLHLNKNVSIFNAGAGTTTLIDELLKRDFKNIIINDISENAIESLKNTISKHSINSVRYIVDDLTNSTKLHELKNKIDVWIDRAVLHFFLEKSEQKAYTNLIDKLLKPKGYIIIAAFALDGSKKCSGLDIKRYGASELQALLGENYKLLKTFNYNYITPSGDLRKYIYTLFQKRNLIEL